MVEERDGPVVLDTTVLSNFASSSSIPSLFAIEETAVTVPAVRDELREGKGHGYDFLAEALAQVGEKIPVIAITSDQVDRYPDLRSRLDLGETQALIGAIERRGTLATDDLAARHVACDHGVPIIGSVGLLVRGIRRDLLTIESANAQLRTWRKERGYYAPVDRIEEVLE